MINIFIKLKLAQKILIAERIKRNAKKIILYNTQHQRSEIKVISAKYNLIRLYFALLLYILLLLFASLYLLDIIKV